MKQGDKLVFKSRGYFTSMTQGKTYAVLDFDPNNGPEWPAGSFGNPMVKVQNDKGGESWWKTYRFKKEETEE